MYVYMYIHIGHVHVFHELSFLRTHFGKDVYNVYV